MAHTCCFTAIPPSATTLSLSGNFSRPDEVDLIVIKCNRLELYRVVDGHRLEFVKSTDVQGRITAACLFYDCRLGKSRLLLLTAKWQLAVMDCVENEIRRTATYIAHTGDMQPPETGAVLRHDAEHQIFGIRIGQDLLKILLWNADGTCQEHCYRFIEACVIDATFLHSCPNPTIAYVYENAHGCHIETLVFDMSAGTFSEGMWKWFSIEFDASMMFSIPGIVNGVFVIGEESVILVHGGTAYYSAKSDMDVRPRCFTCYGIVQEGRHYVLGDAFGHIYSLSLTERDGVIFGFTMNYLTEVSAPNSLTYLGAGMLYIGSRLNDSLLIRVPSLNGEPSGSTVLLQVYPNLGPIVDMIRFDDRSLNDGGNFLTCSGYGKDGSLRVIRGGVSTCDLVEIPISDALQVWPVTCMSEKRTDNVLVVSFICGTRTFRMYEDSVEEVDLFGLKMEARVRFAGNIMDGDDVSKIVLVTMQYVTLLDSSTCRELVNRWTPPDGKRIDIAMTSGNSEYMILSCGQTLIHLLLDDKEVIVIGIRDFGKDISCLDIIDVDGCKPEVCAVGFWLGGGVSILRLPSMEVLCNHDVGEHVPRSVLIFFSDKELRLLIGCSDSSVSIFRLDTSSKCQSLKMIKSFHNVSEPPKFKKLVIRSADVVIACCTSPFLLCRRNQNWELTKLDVGPLLNVVPIYMESYGPSFLFCSRNRLVISQFGELMKTHCHKVHLGETPIRLCRQQATRTIVVCTSRKEVADFGSTNEESSLIASSSAKRRQDAKPFPRQYLTTELNNDDDAERPPEYNCLILDEETFETLLCYKMNDNEQCCSILSCKLGNDPNTYYIVGTALIRPNKIQASVGRLAVFKVIRNSESRGGGPGVKLEIVHEKVISGAPYKMIQFNKKLLVAAGHSVVLFEWIGHGKKHALQMECDFPHSICVLFMEEVSPSLILCGDLKLSVFLLNYKSAESTFEAFKVEGRTNWLTSIAVSRLELFYCTDLDYNLHSVVAHAFDVSSTDKEYMEYRDFHLGQFVNVFCSIPQPHRDVEQYLHGTPIVYATAEGSLGVVCSVKPLFFRLLKALEKRALRYFVKWEVFGHHFWRYSPLNAKKNEASFVDGDVVRKIFDLPKDMSDWFVIDAVEEVNSELKCERFTPDESLMDRIEKFFDLC